MRQKQNKKLNEQLITAIIFLIKLNILSIPLYIILWLNLSYFPFQVFVASVAGEVLKFFGYSLSQFGNELTTLFSGQLLRVDVSWDSTGWKSLYALAALVIASPVAGFRGKLKFIIVTLPVTFLINILRIVSTIYFSLTFGLQYFTFLHTVLWRFISVGVVLILWFVFLWGKRYNIVKTQFTFRIRWQQVLKFLGLKIKSS